MMRLFRLPLQFLEVFTWCKSFRNNPFIGSYLLNRLGLHVFRVITSHILFRFRLGLLSPLVTYEDRKQFMRDGYIIKPQFLSEENL
jgi:hypothetical protein